jgi:hypothetical protein
MKTHMEVLRLGDRAKVTLEVEYPSGDAAERGIAAFLQAGLAMQGIAPRERPGLPRDAHEVRRNEDGSLDEVVGWGFLHLEQMDTGHWWIGFDTADGRLLHINLHARGRIRANVADEGASDLWARREAR